METIRIDPSLENPNNISKKLRVIREIDQLIGKLRDSGITSGAGQCDYGKFELLRRSVEQHFHIPRTNITVPMEILLYAISANQHPPFWSNL